MDFSKFSDDNFDVKDWVNGVFRGQQDEKQREAYTATLVTKLQRYIQEVNKSLEDTSQQAVANLPRVLRDVETLKQESTFLWQQMQQVKDEIRSVEQRTSHSMQVLVRVDDVRSRVEQACEALKEADNWSSLASAMEDIFKSGDIEAIAAQLQSMRASLLVLRNSPDYDDKVMHLEALKNRLETSVSPSVVAAFMQHNTDEAKRYYSIFSSLDRKSELRNYYLKCHRGRISSKWQEIVAGEGETNRGVEQSETSLLREFYELLLSSWHTEVQWCSRIFGKDEAASIVTQLLLEITLSVESGPGNLINNGIQGLAYEKLSLLSQMYTTTYNFTQNMKRAVVDGSQLEKIERRMLAKLSDALWHPYIPHFLQYNVMETETLLSAMSDIPMDAKDIIDLAQLLDLSVKKIFDQAQSSVDRCGKITGFFGACDVIEALEKYFSEYCDRFARQLRTIASSCGLKKSIVNEANTHEHSEEEDWTIFQHCVRIIATCGRILVRFGDFHRAFLSSLLTRPFDDSSDGSTPWMRYNYMKYGDPGRYSRLLELIPSEQETASASVQLFSDAKRRFQELNQQSHNLTFDVAFAQVKRQLTSVPLVVDVTDESDTVVSQSEMPMFSVSPSEGATHIGQYLMTLPQHLEPFAGFDSDDNAEDQALEVALRSGRLPFPPKPGEHEVSESELDNMSDQWLGAIVRATEHTYVEAVTQIETLKPNMARQLVADLDYMGNVIDSLGLSTSKELLHLRELLNVPKSAQDEFKKIAAHTPHRLANVIASMRNMTL